jgi:uncharacterized tellurite resistance protein B-like protein
MSFFDSIKNLMRLSVISQELTSHELEQLHLAIATLMIEMIRADFIELQKEKNIMQEVLNASLELSATEIDVLIEKAEVQSDFTLSLQSHTSIINNYLPQEGKITLLKNLWTLANSDLDLHTLEVNMLNKVAHHLGFNKNQLNTIINS